MEWFRWLAAEAVELFIPAFTPPEDARPHGRFEGVGMRMDDAEESPLTRSVRVDRSFGERLAAVDQLRPEQRSLRAGWLFVEGSRPLPNGRRQRVFHPLLTVPVRVIRPSLMGDALLHAAGDVTVTDLVTDPATRADLERSYEIGAGALAGMRTAEIPRALLRRLDGLHRFAIAAAAAAGFETNALVPVGLAPEELMAHELTIVAGVGVFAVHPTAGLSRAASLVAWAGRRLDTWTAFHSIYLGTPEPAEQRDEVVNSPMLLNAVQREAVRRSRVEPVTVLAGAPGTGKSHAIAAIACDALARDERVLVAAKADATVDALVDLLERVPGPDPVVFGSSEKRELLASRLAGGELRPVQREDVAVARTRFVTAVRRRDELRDAVRRQLAAEEVFVSAPDDVLARIAVPGAFDPRCDLDNAFALLGQAKDESRWWWRRRRQAHARRTLDRICGCDSDLLLEDLEVHLAAAAAVRAAEAFIARGGLDLADEWDALVAVDDEARVRMGEWLAVESRGADRLSRATLGAVSALATALRSGRAARRAQLERIDEGRLTRALPLWIGTLADIEDLLPPTAGLFDLVILDEASSVDQPLAATALLRGRRAVIAGDARQLRHVSFVSDEHVAQVLDANGLAQEVDLAAKLDVRRNSAFDVAVACAIPLALDEHFRSDPHLIEFVARRIYHGRVRVATRTPLSERRDCIEVVRVEGERERDGVVWAEVDAAVEQLWRLRTSGADSVGVVTPFRAQADALEHAILEEFTVDDLEAMDLRVGTVHSFQGNERDMVLLSFGIGPGDSANSWRFVEDPHLFAVLMTRARNRIVLLLSADPPAGLVADYLKQADAPPGRPSPAGNPDGWAVSVADALIDAGVPAMASYPTGRHVIDVCAGDAERWLGVECGVHPDGPDSHIDRHLALRIQGWDLAEAHRSRWRDRRGELVVRLAARLRPPVR